MVLHGCSVMLHCLDLGCYTQHRCSAACRSVVVLHGLATGSGACGFESRSRAGLCLWYAKSRGRTPPDPKPGRLTQSPCIKLLGKTEIALSTSGILVGVHGFEDEVDLHTFTSKPAPAVIQIALIAINFATFKDELIELTTLAAPIHEPHPRYPA